MQRRFEQVDVFTEQQFRGNPLAVIVDAEDVSSEQMQEVATWTNLSETTFLLPPDADGADYRVRIFTPDRELPFAGHPTLGSCAVWLRSGGEPHDPHVIVQECGAGLVAIRRADNRLAFAAPPRIRSGAVDAATLAMVVAALGVKDDAIVDANWADNGPGWIAVLLATAEDVLALDPSSDAGHGLDIGVVGPHDASADVAFEVRAFFPKQGSLAEDPVTGSLNASLAQWLTEAGHATTPYVAAQGTAMGRTGRVYIDEIDGEIWVGGSTVSCVRGTLEL